MNNMAVISGQADFGEYKFDPCKYSHWHADKPAVSHEGVKESEHSYYYMTKYI